MTTISWVAPVTSFAVGDTLTAAEMNNIGSDLTYLLGRVLTHTTFTSPVSITATSESSPTTVVTAAAVTTDGSTPIAIDFFSPSIICPTAASGRAILSVWEGSTQLGRITDNATESTGSVISPAFGRYRITPSAGSHTYHIAGYRITANMNVEAGLGGTGAYVPGFVRVSIDN